MPTRLTNPLAWTIVTVILVAVVLAGCTKPPDAQLVEMAREHAARQAEQNRQMAELQKDITEGSRRLVEADAEARSELVALQHDLQTDQHDIGRQRDLLEQERKEIAGQRFRDQAIIATISAIGLLLVCGLPLVLCVYVLRAVRTSEAPDAVLTEMLVDELTAEQPRLLGYQRTLPHEEEPVPIDPASEEDGDIDEDDCTY